MSEPNGDDSRSFIYDTFGFELAPVLSGVRVSLEGLTPSFLASGSTADLVDLEDPSLIGDESRDPGTWVALGPSDEVAKVDPVELSLDDDADDGHLAPLPAKAQPVTSQAGSASRGRADRLSREQAKVARMIFNRYDTDRSGELDEDEVVLAMQEMGFDSDPQAVKGFFQEHDADNSGTISFDEFRALYASAPPGYFSWSHVDQERLRLIDRHQHDGPHPGFSALADFMRVMEKGVSAHRLTRKGGLARAVVHLAEDRSGLAFRVGFKPPCNLQFRALRAVVAPDLSDAGLSLGGGGGRDRVLLLVFAVRPTGAIPAVAMDLDDGGAASQAGEAERGGGTGS